MKFKFNKKQKIESKEKIKTKEKKKGKSNKKVIQIVTSIVIALIIGIAYLIYSKKLSLSIIIFLSLFIIIELYVFLREKLRLSAKIRKMESVFPDFIELMASNLRAGMTIDKALLLSSRKEFSPLDEEILVLGKDIITGREISMAMKDMGERTKSDKIKKTVSVIISGIRSGGNLAVLLEETAINMRERGFVEKRAASNVLMYIIFIFFSVAVGAPLLFSLSSILVEVLTNLLGNLPAIEANVNIPLKLQALNISITFIKTFSIIFLIVIDILAALLLGLVNKGEEKEGLKYIIPLTILSLTTYFIVRLALQSYFSGFLG